MSRNIRRVYTKSRAVGPELRDVPAVLSEETNGRLDLSSEDAPLPTTTTFNSLRLSGTTLTLKHLKSLLRGQLTRLELKDIKVQGPLHAVKLPLHLVELTVDNCPDLMYYPPEHLIALSHLKKLTLGTDAIYENTVKALNTLDAEKHLIVYGRPPMDDFGCLAGLKKLRSLCIHTTGRTAMTDADIGQLSAETTHFNECEMDLYLSVLEEAQFPCSSENSGSLYGSRSKRSLSSGPLLSVKELEVIASCISNQFPFYKFKNLETIKLWATKEIDQEVLNEIATHMQHLKILHLGGSVVLDVNALDSLRRLENLREILISNAIILCGGVRVLSSLPNLVHCELRCCKSFDENESDDRVFFSI